MRQEVSALLAADAACEAFLKPSWSLVERTVEFGGSESEQLPTIGSYRLLQKIGEGGFGVVYMAEQTGPIHRKVAVKLIRPGMDSKQILARFHAERQALARMDHPSIASVFDAGATEAGLPYFVMELFRGIPIHEFCTQNQLTLNERLRLFVQVCGAVHHAHQKGILHRDLKPSNVLVAMGEAEPMAKVIDFGIAKALDARLSDKTLFTEYGQMLGTLEYMSPEQAEMSAVDVDTRADVYSLGVLLYQLLTGETPLSKEQLLRGGLLELPRLLRETEPQTPSVRATAKQDQLSQIDRNGPPAGLSNLPRGDLDWIALKALAKDRRFRYDSALDFARDIQRFLTGEPVQAHPPSAWYRSGKFVRKHRVVSMAVLAVTLGVVLGVIGLWAGLRQANQARLEAEILRDKALAAQTAARRDAKRLAQNVYSQLVESAWRCVREDDFQRGHELLDAGLPELRGWEWRFVNSQLDAHPSHQLRDPEQAAIVDIAVHEPSQLAACVVENGSIEIRSLRNGDLRQVISGDFVARVAEFTPDGDWLLVGTINGGKLLVYRTADWVCVTNSSLSIGGIYDVAVSQDGTRAAVCAGGAWIELWDASTWQSLQKWHLPARMSSIVFCPDGSEVYGAGLDGQLYRVRAGDPDCQHWFVSESSLTLIDWLDANRVCLLTDDAAASIEIGDPQAGPQELCRTMGVATALDIGPEGEVAIGAGDGMLSALRSTDDSLKRLAKFGCAVRALYWIRSGSELLVSLSDGRLIRLIPQAPATPALSKGSPLVTGTVLPETSLLIGLDEQGWMRAVQLDSGKLVFEEEVHEAKSAWAISVDRDERILATIGEDRRLCCWELPEWKLRWRAEVDWGVRDVCVAPDGSWIAAAPPLADKLGDREGIIGIWDTRTGECQRLLDRHSNWVLRLAITPDGRRLVSACEDRSMRIWDAASGALQATILPAARAAAQHLALDAAGDTLYVGHRDGRVTTWNMQDGAAGAEWPAFGDALSGLAVTPDHRVLATSRSDNRLKVWDHPRRKLLASFDLGVGLVNDFQLFDQGRLVAAMGQDGQQLLRLE